LADFGLCKLIDKYQSKVVTVMRGTPGYLAPEWLTSQITQKVEENVSITLSLSLVFT
jgi:serine/threonine protein kinase